MEEGPSAKVDVEKELGVVLPREWPKTRSGASGGDDDIEPGYFAFGTLKVCEVPVAERRGHAEDRWGRDAMVDGVQEGGFAPHFRRAWRGRVGSIVMRIPVLKQFNSVNHILIGQRGTRTICESLTMRSKLVLAILSSAHC